MKNYQINGDLVSDQVKRIKEEIISLMDVTDTIILDFNQTNYMDSIGLGMLVSIYKESINRSVNIRVKNTNKNIMKLLRITALDEIFVEEG